MRQLPGSSAAVAWPQCGSWLAAWSWNADIGDAACSRCASYPVCEVWPLASRGGQLPVELGMTTGGPRQPSLAQCSAEDSEDRSLWTRHANWLVDAVAGWCHWLLTEVNWWSEDCCLGAVSFIQTCWAEPRLVAAAVSADWSAKRSWIWLVVERCINTSADRNAEQNVIR
jgi:hypothetical protein